MPSDSRRLAPRDGEWIDRGRPVKFRFEGTNYRGFDGDVLSSALWANDVRMLGRSFKYHRPRGIYSLANWDVSAMVEDGDRTNMRGDVLAITPGLDLRAVNTLGGLKRDWLRIIGRFSAFLPVGFYYKAFHTPRRLFPFYEKWMRQVAGLGAINPAATPKPSPKDYAHRDLLVVGAGPSGLAAAIAAAEQGVRVLLVDEQPRPGGSFCWQWGGNQGARHQLHHLLERVAALDNLELRCATQAGGWYADHWVALFDEQRLTKLRTKALIVAGGCWEQPAVFQNNDLPGVMLGSAAQRLIHLYAVKPFDRCVVLAGNRDAYRVALDLHEASVEVAAIVDLRHGAESGDLVRAAADAGIRVFNGHMVDEAVPASGMKGVVGALVRPLDDHGRPVVASPTRIECDGIAVSCGWAPAGGLISQAGGRLGYAEHVEQFVPTALPSSVFAAGRVNGVFELDDQIADGRRAGLAAAAFLGHYGGTVPEPAVHQSAPPSHPYPIFAHDKKKNFVEFDEDLHLTDFVNAHQEGYESIELLKRYTTVGMGPSQGKLANMNAARILARLNGKSIEETGTTTARPFHHPVPMSHLAGRRFHPLRRTPMHQEHARAGAEFVHAGQWLRPEYYKLAGRGPEDCILDEARNVRRNVGIVDVSTLGKVLISGPDAVALLERIYTGRFAKQRVGQLRYALACDETGVIIEDGLVARLAEDRFYVTATSSGAGAFYREMQRWALIWQMNVALSNATAQLAAVNIAGPQARHVLSSLTDVDLSSNHFPYLGIRQGTVAGVSARVLRVGFVGELSYEIHVPASHGVQVWTTLVAAGQSEGIRPFGVEAQRMLRLEKGHIIVSQDTDALTTPYEANLAWAIGKEKAFFVGQRSLAILQKQGLTRRLVGIRFNETHSGPLPEESHLVIVDGQIAGRVTSMAPCSTLGHPIGLAFVGPDQTETGTRVHIRVGGGKMVDAEVTPIPFYDPENERQK